VCRSFTTAGRGRLEGKTVVVAGAGNNDGEEWGIGKCTAILCAREGANVIAVSNNADHARTTEEQILSEGNVGMGFTADCTNLEDVEKLVEAAKAKYGTVDSVINAGVYDALPNGFKKLDPAKWHRSMDLNLHAHYYLVYSFLPVMTAPEKTTGNFVFVSTVAAAIGLGNTVQRHGYAAGKAGAEALTRRIGVEYAPKGIRGNVVSAGYIASPLVTRAVNQAQSAGISVEHADVGATRDSYPPRGKQGEPMDVANACLFMANDDEASFVNAGILFVDGGQHACTYGP
jgi:NAD(P)-dependent dehydrogenase (short-subunit alcohol dehydrogenase family)